MRILIGNQIDPSIRDRGELRAWTQRVLWFARTGDLVVLCDRPDPAFLAYVASFTGVDPFSLRILVPTPGAHGGSLLDPETLTDESFLHRVRNAIGAQPVDEVEEVFALWPSAYVARFVDCLGFADRFPGFAFFAQGGGELANSKAAFREIAIGAGVPIPAGAVCRSPHEAATATDTLLRGVGAVMVKQAHNGAGVGNEILIADPSIASDHVGARHLHRLDGTTSDVANYWTNRWDWASAEGRFPVVVEEFEPDAVSLYSEHHASDEGTCPTEMGRLVYVGRRLSHQIVPLRDADERVREQLLAGGTRLAEEYRSLGYRGHLSADAIALPNGRVKFTEVNAQVSGSLHIYQVIAHQVVDVTAKPERWVVEYHVPPTWAVPDFATFLEALDDLRCAYDPGTRTGVIVSMPVIAQRPGHAQFVFCIAYGTEDEQRDVYARLEQRFSTVPAPVTTDAGGR